MILPPACTTTVNFGSNDDGSSNGTKSLQSYAADQSVNCVAFHPLSFANNEESTCSRNCYNNHDNDVISAAAAAAEIYNNPCMVYATNSNRIYCYDIRQYTTPIVSSTASAAASSPVSSQTMPIIKTPHVDLTLQFQCIDEINQLSFSYPNSNKMNNTIESSHLCMATVDDSGEARVMLNYDTYYDERMSRNNTTTMVLQHAKPETLSIASCAAFRPKQHTKKKKSNYNNVGISYLATAGTDCTIKLWDIDMSDNGNNNSSSSSKSTIRIRHRPPTSTITFGPHDDDNNDDDNVTAAAGTRSTMSTTMKLCNPPYVHSLSWSISGKYLAAGVGDGSIAILRAEGHRLVKVARFRNSGNNSSSNEEKEGHTSAVAAVHYPSFERIVESSRDDGDEHMSKLNIKNGDAISIDEEERLLISAGNDGNVIFWDIGPSKDKANMSLSSPSNKTMSSGAERRSLVIPRILFRISHGHKPNWITSSRSMDAALPNSIFVADTTNNISVYTLPM
jgi:WD40 repeat protein